MYVETKNKIRQGVRHPAKLRICYITFLNDFVTCKPLFNTALSIIKPR